MKKEGVIFFNENLKRYDIGFLKETDGENYGGLHAGDKFEWSNSETFKWEAVRIEYNSENDTWYLIEEKTETSSLHSVEAERYLSNGENKYALYDFEGAVSDYNKAIELDSKNPETYFYRGLSKSNLQNYKGAVSDYNKSIALNPNDSLSYTSRAYAKYELKDFDGSSSDFKKANELDSELKNPNKN